MFTLPVRRELCQYDLNSYLSSKHASGISKIVNSKIFFLIFGHSEAYWASWGLRRLSQFLPLSTALLGPECLCTFNADLIKYCENSEGMQNIILHPTRNLWDGDSFLLVQSGAMILYLSFGKSVSTATVLNVQIDLYYFSLQMCVAHFALAPQSLPLALARV